MPSSELSPKPCVVDPMLLFFLCSSLLRRIISARSSREPRLRREGGAAEGAVMLLGGGMLEGLSVGVETGVETTAAYLVNNGNQNQLMDRYNRKSGTMKK